MPLELALPVAGNAAGDLLAAVAMVLAPVLTQRTASQVRKMTLSLCRG